MKLPSPGLIIQGFVQAWTKFPAVMLMGVLGVANLIWAVETDGKEPLAMQLFLVAAVGVPLMLSARIIAERYALQTAHRVVVYVVVLALMTAFYLSMGVAADGQVEMPTIFRFLVFNAAAHLLVAVAPWLRSDAEDAFWEYNQRLLVNMVVGAFYAILLYGALAIAIGAVNQLFEMKIDGKLYAYLFFFIAGVVHLSYFLHHFPKLEGDTATEPEQPYRFVLRNLVKFIAIPVVGLYFLILYAYSLKITLSWELPKGWVGSLVLGFSVVGLLAWLLNYRLPNFDENRLLKFFRRWFFPVLLPMTFLLLIAIGRRISDYGVTEMRFVVAALGAWLLLISAYFLLRKKVSIKAIPLSLIAVAAVVLVGPWNAHNVAGRSQSGRLKALFEQAGMWQDGAVMAAPDSLDPELSYQIDNVLDYLNEWVHVPRISHWHEALSGADGRIDYAQVSHFKDQIGLSNTGLSYNTCTFSFASTRTFDISGYTRVWQLNVNTYDASEANRLEADTLLVLTIPEGEEIKLNLVPVLNTYYQQYGCTNPGNLDPQSLPLRSEGWEIVLQLTSLTASRPNNWRLQFVEGLAYGRRIGSGE